MKKSIKLAVVAALALGTTSAFATNGDHLIGIGAKARGMGGVGIGMSHGAESGIANPALISSVEGTEVSFGGTFFNPNVSYDGGAGYKESDADLSVIPSVSIANKVNDNFYWGVGMWGTAGMGVDHRDDTTGSTMQMVTNLQLMQFGVPLTYAVEGFSVGVTPLLQYGALDINYNMLGTEYGEGVAQDLAFGYNIGAAYEIAGVTIGAVYKSAIDMEYNGQLSSATQPFADFGIFPGAMADNLEQPAEIGIGVSYTIAGSTIAADYKQIKWGDAKGYKDFNWQDQNVFALGYEFAAESWAVRVGYNYAENPIEALPAGPAQDGTVPMTSYAGDAINMFNLAGFPATTESHFTIGGTYAFSKQISLDGAFTYASETTTTFDTSGLASMGMGAPEVSVKHSQNALTVGLNYNF